MAMKALALLALTIGLAAPASAQDPLSAPVIDVTRLGVDLSRIKEGLRMAETSEQQAGEGFRLNVNVQVFGVAPKIHILTEADLYNGHVPGTAPTHRQLFDQVTPQIYRQPGVDFFGLAIMAVQHLWE